MKLPSFLGMQLLYTEPAAGFTWVMGMVCHLLDYGCSWNLMNLIQSLKDVTFDICSSFIVFAILNTQLIFIYYYYNRTRRHVQHLQNQKY